MPWPNKNFYQDGLRFSCTACGKCCSNHNEYDFVYLTSQDIKEISRLFKTSRSNFLKTYGRSIDGHHALKDRGDDCIFLKENGHCEIYTARPLQCRTYPFWPENLNERIWHGVLTEDCPGIGQGESVPPKQIKKFLAWDRKDEYDEQEEE